MNLNDSYTEFLTVLNLRGLAESTFKNYTSWTRRFLDFLSSEGIQDTSEIELRHARKFTVLQHEKYAASTYNCCVCAVNFYYEAVLGQVFPKRYLPYAKVPKDNTLAFTDEQVGALIEKAPDLRLRTAIILAADTGMRISEVLSVRFRDIDRNNRTILVEKTKRDKSRIVKYGKESIDRLNEYVLKSHIKVRPNYYLFPVNEKKPEEHVSQTYLSKQFHDFLQGFSFYIPNLHKFHSLRHFFATAHVEEGTPFLTLEKMMGHGSAATTEMYVHTDAIPQTSDFSPLDKWFEKCEQLEKEDKSK